MKSPQIAVAAAALFVPHLVLAGAPQSLPAEFIGDRVFVDAELKSGQHLRLYTDSGGGSCGMLSASAAQRLELKPRAIKDPEMRSGMGADARMIDFPALARRSPLPALAGPCPAIVTDHLMPPGWPAESDGQLGNAWFGGHVWTWDYSGRKLLLEPVTWQPAATDSVIPLGFKKAIEGMHAPQFPRITIRIDGKELSMLLDTGAMTVLTPEAAAVVDDGSTGARATSMIVSTLFRSWHQRHPDWRYIDKGQLTFGADMIEVPEVQIAGHAVGPVWFTERPDTNFHDMMSSGMDRQVEGAVGGNVFRAFRMTVDYPNARAAFRCVQGCRKIVASPRE